MTNPTWTLRAPDGREWHGATKLKCMAAETNDRVPASVQLERIYAAAFVDDDEELDYLCPYAPSSPQAVIWQNGYRAALASPPSPAITSESATEVKGDCPDWGEFEVWQRDEMCASSSGPRDDALRDAMHYASQYGQDGPVRVVEVHRVPVVARNRDGTDHG